MTTPNVGGIDIDMVAQRPSIAVSVPASALSGVLFGSACLLTGWSVRDTDPASGGHLEFYDGDTTGGQLVGSTLLGATGQLSFACPGGGVLCRVALSFSGSGTRGVGVVWVVPIV